MQVAEVEHDGLVAAAVVNLVAVNVGGEVERSADSSNRGLVRRGGSTTTLDRWREEAGCSRAAAPRREEVGRRHRV